MQPPLPLGACVQLGNYSLSAACVTNATVVVVLFWSAGCGGAGTSRTTRHSSSPLTCVPLPAVGASAVVDCAVSSVTAPWPQFMHDSMHSGRSPFVGPSTPTLLWQAELNTAAQWAGNSPIIGADGSIYSAFTDSCTVYSLDGVTGAVMWRVSPSGGCTWFVTACPALGADGTIYIGGDSESVYALDGSTGAVKWQVQLYYTAQSPPALSPDGQLVLFGSDGVLYALNSSTGSIVWMYTSWTFLYTPVFGTDGVIYTSNGDAWVFALTSSGKEVWFVDTHTDFGLFSPSLSGCGLLYLGSFGGSVLALNASSGASIWSFLTTGSVHATPALASDGTVVIGSGDQYVYALHGGNGALKWKYLTGGAVVSSAAIGAGDMIYVASDDGVVRALTLDGVLSWQFDTQAPVGNSPVLGAPVIGANSMLYVQGWGGYVYAIGVPSSPSDSPTPSASPSFGASHSPSPTPPLSSSTSFSSTHSPSTSCPASATESTSVSPSVSLSPPPSMSASRGPGPTGSGPSMGAIAGIAGGACGGLVMLGCLCWRCRHRRKKLRWSGSEVPLVDPFLTENTLNTDTREPSYPATATPASLPPSRPGRTPPAPPPQPPRSDPTRRVRREVAALCEAVRRDRLGPRAAAALAGPLDLPGREWVLGIDYTLTQDAPLNMVNLCSPCACAHWQR